MSARRPVKSVTICKPHGAALLVAAEMCGCHTDETRMQFLADCVEASLYDPVRAFVGEAAGDYCLVCVRAFEEAAIDEAVVAALALRERHGIKRKLQ
jgi:hypothetical protein